MNLFNISNYDLYLEVNDGNIVSVGVDLWRLSQLTPRQLETEKQTERSANHPSTAAWPD